MEKSAPIYKCKSCGEEEHIYDGEKMVLDALPSHGLCRSCWAEENEWDFGLEMTPEEIERERLCTEYIWKHKLQPNLDFPE